jgi:DNA-binding beta-propeller fold protein YncE
VGTEPQGVAEIPRLGLALVANNGSNDASIVDVTETKVPTEVPLCGVQCSAPVGVAVNQDSATGVITNTNPGSSTTLGSVSLIDVTAASATLGPTLDHDPVAVAIDPNPQYPYAAVATDSSTSSIDFLNIAIGGTLVGRTSGLSNPTGIVFDPVNQVFLVANSLQNEVVIIDPTSFLPTPVAVGIGPTSLDYNYQTRTLVTVNSISHTMSILAYTCPPSLAAPACTGPQVATVVGLGGTQATAPVFGPNAIAVDPILNLAVLIDEDNNQVLLIPLPH